MHWYIRFFIIIGCFICCEAMENSVVLLKDSITSYLPFDIINNGDRIRFTKDAAIHGDSGLEMNVQKKYDRERMICHLPFMKKQWYSFYFRIDQNRLECNDTCYVEFTGILPDKIENETWKPNLLNFVIIKASASNQLFICFKVSGSSDKENKELNRIVNAPIFQDKIYSSETCFDFYSPESVSYEWFLNGKSIVHDSIYYPYKKEYYNLSIYYNSYKLANFNPFRICLDDFLVSDKRRYAIPPAPYNLKLVLDTVRASFSDPVGGFCTCNILSMITCDTALDEKYDNESLYGVRWRLFTERFPDLPLYCFQSVDVAYVNKLLVPFPLDSGNYLVQAAWKNNFNNWGDFCKPYRLEVKRKRFQPFVINKMSFFKSGSRASANTLVPDVWYDLNLEISNKVPWEQCACTAAATATRMTSIINILFIIRCF